MNGRTQTHRCHYNRLNRRHLHRHRDRCPQLHRHEATVSEPDQLTINLVGVDILCFGENTGEITSSSTGGVGGNEYLWSNIGATITGLTTASINNLNNGKRLKSPKRTKHIGTSNSPVSINGNGTVTTGGTKLHL
ncbi:MAG: SprB repeat-containing protein [Chitinophagales bacterium]